MSQLTDIHMQKRFNIRVYGILEHNGKILVSDEIIGGKKYTKFPGGGLEWGEGMLDGLKREFTEELNLELSACTHYYTTDYFQVSAYNPHDQVISVYYKVKTLFPEAIRVKSKRFEFDEEKERAQIFRWIDLPDLSEEEFHFPIDKIVASMLRIK